MSDVWTWAIRVSAFLRKELVEVVRQPVLVLSLVLGPFLVLLLFGAGIEEDDPPLRTVFVAPQDSRLAEQVTEFAETQRERLEVVGVSQDEAAAVRDLRRGNLELVVVFAEDAEERIEANEQAEITLYHNQLDPVENQAIELFARTAVDQINQQVLYAVVQETQAEAGEAHERLADARSRTAALRAAAERDDEPETRRQQRLLAGDVGGLAAALAPAAAVLGGRGGDAAESGLQATLDAVTSGAGEVTDEAADPSVDQIEELESDLARLDEGLSEFRALDPQVIVAPFRGETHSIGGSVGLSDFYAPAVVALLLQHMVLTFLGLSIVREDALGTFDLFRVSPLSAAEALIGKTLAYLLLGWVVGAALIALLVFGLGVPMAGSWLLLAAGVTALLLASIGVGFVLALVARTDSQAVQYAMLFLLASVFFSGFLLSLDRFQPLVRPVSWLLPVTFGTHLLRDVMLRGRVEAFVPVLVLLAMAAVLLGAGLLLLRGRLRRA